MTHSVVGTLWRENDKRFVRIVEVASDSPQKIGRLATGEG